jgi:hypothetical protein
VEVMHNIIKYLSKLERLEASIYVTINIENTSFTEEMMTIIAKRLRQLDTLYIYIFANVDGVLLRLKQMLPNADIGI